MRTRAGAIALALLAPALASAVDELQAMFEKAEAAKEKARCEQLVASPKVDARVDGHVCLAQLALRADKPILTPVRDRYDRTTVRPVPGDAAANAALAHLQAARKLAPGRLEVHRDVLEVTTRAMRFLELPGEVRESIALVPRGKRGALLDTVLLPALYSLTEDARYEEALAVARVLEPAYPRSNQVASSIGGALLSLGRDAEALPYLERAVALAPKDPIDRWNLGQYRARQGKLREADRDLAKAVALTKPAERSAIGCQYAAFVELALKDRPRACDLQKSHCPAGARSACGAPAEGGR
jgi:tetratricopeptide (TPR) repeat protein